MNALEKLVQDLIVEYAKLLAHPAADVPKLKANISECFDLLKTHHLTHFKSERTIGVPITTNHTGGS